MASSDVEKWQCDKSLQQCLAHMLNNQIMCDVTFQIGEERAHVQAHKLILASRSPVFHDMFYGPKAEQGNIERTDIDHEIFQLFLKYIYTDDICLTIEKVMSIMYVAKEYRVDRLTSKCKQFVQGNINSNNACKLMDEAKEFADEDIQQSCLHKIKRDTEECLQSPEFVNICKENLELISKLEEKTIEEETLYEQIIKWCDAECTRQQLEVTWPNKREVLGNIIFNIRFSAMKERYFYEEVATTEFLTDEERDAIVNYHAQGRQGDLTDFNKNDRFIPSPPEDINDNSSSYGSDYSDGDSEEKDEDEQLHYVRNASSDDDHEEKDDDDYTQDYEIMYPLNN